MTKFTFVQLEYLCAVAERGSLVAAAEQLNISAAAVSSGIAALEKALDAELILGHKSQGSSLTAIGRQFYAQAKNILREADEAEHLVAGGEAGELVGTLSVGCFPTLAPTLLPEVVRQFRERHPRVTFNYTISDQSDLLQKLSNNDLDIAVMYDLYLPDGFQQEHLKSASVYIMVAADHWAGSRKSVRLKDLEPEPVVLFNAEPANTHSFTIFQNAGVSPNITYRGPEYELIRGMIAQGLGYSLMIHKPAHNLTYEGKRLSYVPITPALPQESIVGLWPMGVSLSRRGRAFLATARHVLSDSALGD